MLNKKIIIMGINEEYGTTQIRVFSEEEIRNQELLRKNNEKLDELCKNICLIIGWSLVICLFMYIIFIEMCK